MESLSSRSCQIRKKAVWGRSFVIGLMAVVFAVSSVPAEAQRGWGHGTHVAGIIAGSGYDSSGVLLAIARR